MRRLGFLSNRLYDALASGAFVISDNVPGIDEEFDGGVVAYDSPADLRALVDRYLADAPARTERAARGRAAVLARHTFAHRVATISEIVDPILAGRPSRVIERPSVTRSIGEPVAR